MSWLTTTFTAELLAPSVSASSIICTAEMPFLSHPCGAGYVYLARKSAWLTYCAGPSGTVPAGPLSTTRYFLKYPSADPSLPVYRGTLNRKAPPRVGAFRRAAGVRSAYAEPSCEGPSAYSDSDVPAGVPPAASRPATTIRVRVAVTDVTWPAAPVAVVTVVLSAPGAAAACTAAAGATAAARTAGTASAAAA